jgi:hypothetical protein
MPRPACARGALLAALAAGCGTLGERAPATPQRPRVSSATTTTAPGTQEIELGAAIDPGDALDVPLTAKWGAGERSELFVGWSPYRGVDVPGDDEDGVGDVVVGLRTRALDETPNHPAAAFQAAVKIPTHDEGALSSGEPDLLLAGIADVSPGDFGVTSFYELGVLGDPDHSAVEIRHSLALAASHPIGERFGGFGELAFLLTPEVDDEQLLLTLGGTFAPVSWRVFDVGVAIGLSEDAPDLVLLFGLTENLGALLGPRARLPAAGRPR